MVNDPLKYLKIASYYAVIKSKPGDVVVISVRKRVVVTVEKAIVATVASVNQIPKVILISEVKNYNPTHGKLIIRGFHPLKPPLLRSATKVRVKEQAGRRSCDKW